MARSPAPDALDPLFAPAGLGDDPDGFPTHPEDIGGAKGTGPSGEMEADDDATEEMADEDYENAISEAINAAEFYIDNEVSPDREMLARYYAAEPFGNEEVGRSHIVVPEVRAAVLGHMPGLMRTFCGTERFVEFQEAPGTPREQADFQTSVIEHVITADNPNWYLEFQAAIDDACRRRTGVFTWWWEEIEEVSRTTFSGLNEDAFALLQMEAQDQSDADENISYDVTITDQVEDQTQEGGSLLPPMLSDVANDPQSQSALEMMGAAPPTLYIYSGVLNRRVIRKRARFRAVPPEEFIITPTNSSNLDKYQLIGTREEKTIGELVALGHDEGEIRDAIDGQGATAGGQTSLALNSERMRREESVVMERIFDNGFGEVDPASEKVKYCVVYVLIDRDGDGIPERRKICTVGENNKIIYDEIHEDDSVPFGVGTPYPEPHAPFGMSVADMAMDVQEVKSELIRGTLDSLAESIATRLAFWQGKVNVDDVLNTRRGAAIRTTDMPGNVLQNIAAPFVGGAALPLIQYTDEEATKRSGKNPASPNGFDPDSTQSTAREAIGSMIDAANERTEYIARNLAETMFKRLFIGLRNLIIRNQDHRRIMRIMGQDMTVDPRPWVASLDVRVLVGTGRTSQTKKAMILQQVIDRQYAIFEKYGPGNGVVTLENISNATQDFLRASGFADPHRYIGRVTPELEQQMIQKAAEAAQKPTPEQMLAQIQQQKNQQDFAAKMAKITADRGALILRDDQLRDKAEQDWALGVAKILGDYGIKIDEAAVRERMADEAASTEMANNAVADATPQPNPEAPK